MRSLRPTRSCWPPVPPLNALPAQPFPGRFSQVGNVWLGVVARVRRELLFLFFYSGNVFPPVIHQILLEFNTHQL